MPAADLAVLCARIVLCAMCKMVSCRLLRAAEFSAAGLQLTLVQPRLCAWSCTLHDVRLVPKDASMLPIACKMWVDVDAVQPGCTKAELLRAETSSLVQNHLHVLHSCH